MVQQQTWLARPVTFESNRDVRFEFKSNLEASQVPTLKSGLRDPLGH